MSEAAHYGRRYAVVEESIPTEEKFHRQLYIDDIPRVGDYLQFVRDDGGYVSYVVNSIVYREVFASAAPEYVLYILVGRTVVDWQPLS